MVFLHGSPVSERLGARRDVSGGRSGSFEDEQIGVVTSEALAARCHIVEAPSEQAAVREIFRENILRLDPLR
jgi:hypothetical protein